MKVFLYVCLLITIPLITNVTAQINDERADALNKLQLCVADSTQCENVDKTVKVLVMLFEKGDEKLAKPLIELGLPKVVAVELFDFYWKIYRDNTELFLSVIADKKPNIQRQYFELASFFRNKKEIKAIEKKLSAITKENRALTQVANLGLQEFERTSKPYYFSGFEYPIAYGKKDDGFPDEIFVEGTIVEVSMSWGRCGTLAYAGTMKIKLDKKIKGYNDDFAYVLITCFFDEGGKDKYLNKCLKLKLNKLYEKDYQFSAALSNDSDSKGVPFYLTNYFGEDDLYQKVKCN